MKRSRIISWLIVLAIMIAVQTGSASLAVASCGDYLLHGDSREFTHSRMATGGDSLRPDSVPIPKAPCRGPKCQKGPIAPAMPLPVQVLTADRDWLDDIPAATVVVAKERTRFDREDRDRPVTGYLLSIEHPPRTLS